MFADDVAAALEDLQCDLDDQAAGGVEKHHADLKQAAADRFAHASWETFVKVRRCSTTTMFTTSICGIIFRLAEGKHCPEGESDGALPFC